MKSGVFIPLISLELMLAPKVPANLFKSREADIMPPRFFEFSFWAKVSWPIPWFFPSYLRIEKHHDLDSQRNAHP